MTTTPAHHRAPSVTHPVPHPVTHPVTATRSRRLALLTSVLVTLIGASWFAGDGLYFFDGDDRASLIELLPQRLAASVAVLLGVIGLVAFRLVESRTLVAVASVQAIVFGMLAGDAGALILMGYLIALTLPFGLVVLLLWAGARSSGARLVLALTVVAVSAAVLRSGVFTGDSLPDLADELVMGLREQVLSHVVVAVLVGHGLAWAAVGIVAARRTRLACSSCGRPGHHDVVRRWGRPVTWLAVVCALPYGLSRLTWLTDHPYGVDRSLLEADPGMRVMGLLLGLAGLGAATLIVGLLRPWGRIFTRWIPVVGGRPVPVLLPTIAAVSVGMVIAIAGRSMLQSVAQAHFAGEHVESIHLLLLPLYVWGPALMFAGYAYYLRSRGPCPACGRSDATEPAPTA